MTDVPRESSHSLLTNIITVNFRTNDCVLPYTLQFTIYSRIISFIVPLDVFILRTLILQRLTYLPWSRANT